MGNKTDRESKQIDLMRAAYARSLGGVLERLGSAFDASETRMLELKDSDASAEYKQFLRDEESRLVQAIYGTAFTVCQAYIAAVVANARQLSQSLPENRSPKFLPVDERMLRNAMGSDLAGRTGYSKIEVIHALANYFKHSDEWAKDQWDRPSDKGRGYTVKVLLACGLQNNGKVLEEGARLLGLMKGQWLPDLDSIFSEWSHRVAQAAKAELMAKR